MHKPKLPPPRGGPGGSFGPGELKGGLTGKGKLAVGTAVALPAAVAADKAIRHKKVLHKSAFGIAKYSPLRSARGVVLVSNGANASTRSRSGGWLLKPKTTISQLAQTGEKLTTTQGGGLTGAGKYLTGAGATGGAVLASSAHKKRYRLRNETTTVKVKVRKGHSMSDSAFGVEHVSKKEAKTSGRMSGSEASAGRHASAYAFRGLHGAVAGKQGHKLRAVGNEVGIGAAGGLAGLGAGAAITAASRGKIGPVTASGIRGGLTAGGGVTGSMLGTNRAQNKGHYQKQKPGKTPFMKAHQDAQDIIKAFAGANRLMAATKLAGNRLGAKAGTSGAALQAQASGAKLRTKLAPVGAKIGGMSTGNKLALGATGGAVVGVGGGLGAKKLFGKAYTPNLPKLKSLSRAAHADALQSSFSAKKMPGAAQRAARVRNAATTRSGGQNSARQISQAQSPTTASGALTRKSPFGVN